jgi:hypothetical protein
MTLMKYTILAIALTLTSILATACDDGKEPVNATPAPEGYSNLIVFIGDGVWDPTDPNFVAPTMEEVQREYWGFSDADVQQYEADAKGFFLTRFGIDVDDPANADRILFIPYAADPRMGYRVVSMANRVVPAEGWPVIDAAYIVTIVDPAGFELGGDFAGVTVAADTRVTIGRYYIDTGEGDPLLIDFQSVSPYNLDPFGLGAIECELSSEQLGAGEAYAAYRLGQQPSGDFALTASTVLTFK